MALMVVFLVVLDFGLISSNCSLSEGVGVVIIAVVIGRGGRKRT